MKYNLIAAVLVGMMGSAHGQFRELWHLGESDGNANDFTQELAGSPPEPGSPLKRDDDYYFAGTYPDPIGKLTADEVTGDAIDGSAASANPTGFERAITHSSTNSRIHFNLSGSEANADASYRFTLNLFGGGFSGGGYGTHDVDVYFNDTIIHTANAVTENRTITETIAPGDVGSVEGPNKIEIVRTGGVNGGAVSGWIQFDNIVLEIDESAIVCSDAICNFSTAAASVAPGTPVSLNWLTASDAVVSIDNGVGAVTAGSGSVEVTPAKSTTYTLTSTLGGVTETATVEVSVDLLFGFSAAPALVSPVQKTATLQWTVDGADDVTVSIDQGVGDVTALTSSGFGSVNVSPIADTTYIITVTRPNTPTDEVETASVFVDFEFDDYKSLWQLGVADGTPGEFNQEVGGANPEPGSPTNRDDDYYFAGIYESVGIVAADEIVTDPIEQNGTSANAVGFERAIVAGDPDVRIHFILSEEDAAPGKEFRFQTILQSGGWWDAEAAVSGVGFGTHDVEMRFNGVLFFTQSEIVSPVPVREHLATETVKAVAGENIIQITRTGGDSNPATPGASNGWIQFDYLSLESRGDATSALGFRITDFSHNATSGQTSLTFPSRLGQTFKIETSPDLESWTAIETTLPADADGTETTYSFSQATPKSFLKVTRN